MIDLAVIRADSKVFPDFNPGQYATLSFPGNPRLHGERSFSIRSAPTSRESLRFGIRMHGRYTSELRNLRPGDPVDVAGPYGKFTFNPLRDRSVVFLAGGIGVTPFLSMIRYATDNELPNNLLLLYSFRSTDDAPFLSEIIKMTDKNPHLNTVMAVSEDRLPAKSYQFVPGRITAEVLARALNGNIKGRTYFLCGPPLFMKSMTELLQRMGLSKSDIRTESFSVGSSALIEKGTPMPGLAFATWGVVIAVLFGTVLNIERSKNNASNITDQATLSDVNDGTYQDLNINTSNANQVAPTQPVTPITTNVNQAPVKTKTSRPITPTNTATVQPKPTPTPTPMMPVQPRTKVS